MDNFIDNIKTAMNLTNKDGTYIAKYVFSGSVFYDTNLSKYAVTIRRSYSQTNSTSQPVRFYDLYLNLCYFDINGQLAMHSDRDDLTLKFRYRSIEKCLEKIQSFCDKSKYYVSVLGRVIEKKPDSEKIREILQL